MQGKVLILTDEFGTRLEMKPKRNLFRRLVSRQMKYSGTQIHVSERGYKEYISLKKEIDEETLRRYWKYAKDLIDWLGPREIDEQTLARYNAALKRKYARNSRIVTNSAINWLLRMLRAKDNEGESLRLRIPAKETSPHGRLVSESEWQQISRHARTRLDLRECVLVYLLRESLLRPSDIVRVRLSNLDLESDPPAIVKLIQRKTKFVASPRISLETGRLIKKYLKTYRPLEYLFEGKPGRPFHRGWPTETLRRITHAIGIRGITPRTFRRTGATEWEGRVATLQLQGGWKDAKTIYRHYLKYREEDHVEDFRATFEKPRKDVADASYFA